MAEYREAIRLAPNFAWPHANLGLALYLRGDRQTGFNEIRIAHALAPNDPQITALYQRVLSQRR